jgi:hypothetical protein
VRPPLLAVLAALSLAPSAYAMADLGPKSPSCGGAGLLICSPNLGQSKDWGQGRIETVAAVFEKVRQGAEKEKFALDSRGILGKLFNTKPEIAAKIDMSSEYLPSDSPAVATKDKDGVPVVRVGRAALDACQSEGEMAFVLGHELHHTLVQDRKKECIRRGLRLKGGNAILLKYSPEMKKYSKDLEREADSWGQKYMMNARLDGIYAVQAVENIRRLGAALGAIMPEDEHASFADRQMELQQFGAARFEVTCPWPET